MMLASEVARETALLAVAAVLSVLPVRVILLGLSRPLPYRLVLFLESTSIVKITQHGRPSKMGHRCWTYWDSVSSRFSRSIVTVVIKVMSSPLERCTAGLNSLRGKLACGHALQQHGLVILNPYRARSDFTWVKHASMWSAAQALQVTANNNNNKNNKSP
jgi:hypothetical protein